MRAALMVSMLLSATPAMAGDIILEHWNYLAATASQWWSISDAGIIRVCDYEPQSTCYTSNALQNHVKEYKFIGAFEQNNDYIRTFMARAVWFSEDVANSPGSAFSCKLFITSAAPVATFTCAMSVPKK